MKTGSEDIYHSDENQDSNEEEEDGDVFPNVENDAIVQNDSDSPSPSDNECNEWVKHRMRLNVYGGGGGG